MLHLMGRESELDSFRHVCGGDERPQVQVAAREMLIRPKEIIFHQKGCQALEQVAQVACEISVLADTQNSTEQTHTGSALSNRLDQTSPRGLFQLRLLYDSVNKAEFKVLCFPVPLFQKGKEKISQPYHRSKVFAFQTSCSGGFSDRAACLRAVRGQGGRWELPGFGDWRIKRDKKLSRCSSTETTNFKSSLLRYFCLIP